MRARARARPCVARWTGGEPPGYRAASDDTGAGSTDGSGTATSDVSTSDASTSGMTTSDVATSDVATDVSGSDGSSTGGACVPMTPCFTGSPDMMDVGLCHGGQSTCTPEGEFVACEGEVVPHLDPCDTPEDEDCNGSLEDCSECIPATVKKCYTGPDGTEGLGICVGGTKQCTDMGMFGPCMREVKPIPEEICGNMSQASPHKTPRDARREACWLSISSNRAMSAAS